MKILITGGPVYGKIDPVKLVTNRFKGGLMAQLADELAPHAEVHFLCAKGGALPKDEGVIPHFHDGFHDYRDKVFEMAPDMDVIVLGAAVANLLPVRYFGKSVSGDVCASGFEPVAMPLPDKFPSHNYKPGDRIVMEWEIAPRIIDGVRERMKKTAHLLGFKLLSGQPHEELVRAAYEVLLSSRATAVIANDPTVGLDKKFIVTKERGVHPVVGIPALAEWISEIANDVYYKTAFVPAGELSPLDIGRFLNFVNAISIGKHFIEVEGGLKFGTVALRLGGDIGFLTTGRGKHEVDEMAHVVKVDHKERVVYVSDRYGKATLNAPLLDNIYRKRSDITFILHTHHHNGSLLKTFPYAPPGTVRDSERDCSESFNIDGHGCFYF